MGWHDWVRTAEIEPSLYAADFSELGEQVEYLLYAGARIFHFDVGDGHFVEPITMGPVVLKSIAGQIHKVGGVIDCHLMVDNPEHHFPQIKEAGGDSVTFHVEVSDEPWNTIRAARAFELGVGVAFKPETEVTLAVEAALGADLALCMSIHPGYSGQEFLPDSLSRIRRLRQELPSSLFVRVDGGITLENAAEVRRAGADLIVAGTAIFGMEDMTRSYKRLVKALE
jgi:ribulose-phosphate 3-epimerase